MDWWLTLDSVLIVIVPRWDGAIPVHLPPVAVQLGGSPERHVAPRAGMPRLQVQD